MGADPIAMCGNCRSVTGYFELTACVGCINERFNTDIDKVEGRVLTSVHEKDGAKVFSEPHCHLDSICVNLQKVVEHTKQGHRILVDPCW